MKAPLSAKVTFVLFAILNLACSGLFWCCSRTPKHEDSLPLLGERIAVSKVQNGKRITDTVSHQIPSFSFINQDSQQVTDKTFAHKIYVSDFVFTSCPTICPKMKTQMLRVYEQFKDTSRVLLLSHTLDPQHDSVAVLRNFAQRLGVSSKKWHFVTGPKDSIYAMASKYMITATKKDTEVIGLVHSAAFVLVDTNRHIRGIYDGTQPEQVDQLLADIQILLSEIQQNKTVY